MIARRSVRPRFLEELRTQSQAEGGFVAILEICGFNNCLIQPLAADGPLPKWVVQWDRLAATVDATLLIGE